MSQIVSSWYWNFYTHRYYVCLPTFFILNHARFPFYILFPAFLPGQIPGNKTPWVGLMPQLYQSWKRKRKHRPPLGKEWFPIFFLSVRPKLNSISFHCLDDFFAKRQSSLSFSSHRLACTSARGPDFFQAESFSGTKLKKQCHTKYDID